MLLILIYELHHHKKTQQFYYILDTATYNVDQITKRSNIMNANVILYSPITNLKTKGVPELKYVEMNNDVISLYSYRGRTELSIILINDSQIDSYLKDIEKISRRSTVCIAIIADADSTQYLTLSNIVDTIIPVKKTNSDDIYSILRSFIEPFTIGIQQIIGVDITDIHYITRSKGIAQSLTVDIDSIDILSKALSEDYILSSSGVFISIIASEADVSTLERVDDMVRQYTIKDITVVSSMIEDKRMTEGKIVLVFTGIQ